MKQMSSKSKKHSKTASRLNSNSNSDQQPSTPLSSISPYDNPIPDTEINEEEELLCALEKVSRKFPSLISKTALVCKVYNDATAGASSVVESMELKGCKIWLSELAMVASSIAPGSIVSVSLASSRKLSSHYPLCSLADECAMNFGLDFTEKLADDVGCYFALATVFPSSKLVKNAARLSLNLLLTMGCPASGRTLYIDLLRDQPVMGFSEGPGSSFTHSNVHSPTEKSNCNLISPMPYQVECKDAYFVDHGTKVSILPWSSAPETPLKGTSLRLESVHGNFTANVPVDLPKLGGLAEEFAVLKDIIITSAVSCNLTSLGLRPTKGVLLHGPPGTGKTSLVKLCAHEAGVNLFSVNGPEIISQYYGESERALHEAFDSASKALPAMVFIDELDAIAPARKDGGEELSQRMVATLLNLMDGISRTDGLVVIAATNRPDSVEPALRRPGRLDREIEIGVPSPKKRFEILLLLLSEIKNSLLELDVQHLATATHGFVGADLAALCNEAALICLRRYVDLSVSHGGLECDPSHDVHDISSTGVMNGCCNLSEYNLEDLSSSISNLHISTKNADGVEMGEIFVRGAPFLRVTYEDFEKARVKVRPSAMREVILEVPKVSWEDVGGQREIKMQLMEAVEWPQKHHDAFKRIGTRPPTGVLMFGPPGCSKTLLARAVASEAGLNFLAVKGPELFSKWVGESEKAVRSLFAKARANAPSIIFFDEIDGLAVTRGKESDGVSVSDRVMSQLLVELDGLHERVNVTVIAATNRPDKIDPALLRPGRFDRLLYVGPPDKTDREEIFRVHLHKMPCSSGVSIKELALLTEGYTGADISLVCREAAIAAIEENFNASEVTVKHLKAGILQVQPSEILSYEELSNKFQRLVHSNAEDV